MIESYLYEVLIVVKTIETESRRVVAGRWMGRIGGYCLTNIEFQFCRLKRVMEMDGGDD